MKGSSPFGPMITGGGFRGPTEEEVAQMQEQQHVMMIEGYRQNCAMHFMMSILTADKIRADGDPVNFERIADNAKRAADALVEKVFFSE